MILGQPCCICIKEENFDLKGSETDVAGILFPLFCIPSPRGQLFKERICSSRSKFFP